MFLKVDSAYPEDQGGGKARLDPDTMLQLRLSPGDLVYIEGKRRTVAKVWRMMVSDWHQGKIRIDNFTRSNAGVSIGDRVQVIPVDEPREASRVVLAPPEDLPRQLPINYDHVISRLIDFPAMKNDSVPIQAGLPFMQPQLVAFKVVGTDPDDAVIITKNTKVEISEKPEAGFEGLRHISYEDIGGLKDELQRVRETIELPMRHPELFRKLGIDPPKGVLLYGPPGTGKTLIAKAVASESGAHFIPIAGPEVISKYYGESEQRLREIFEEAQENAPSIIFIDELDSIAPRREDVTGEVERRVVAQLLTMMDGLEERGQVVVIGATNRLDAIDPALRRPGRFDREIDIGVPTETDRREVLRIHTRGMPLEGEARLVLKRKELAEFERALKTQSQLPGDLRTAIREAGPAIKDADQGADLEGKPPQDTARHELPEREAEDIRADIAAAEEDVRQYEEENKRSREKFLDEFAAKTTGFVGADLAALAREGAMRALRRYLPHIDLDTDQIPDEIVESMEVTISDFRDAIREVNPSAMREVFLEVSHITWEEVGGLSREKEDIREAVEYPLTRADLFDSLGIEPPKGVLLYGPPGTGKTLIAKAVANESGANFIPVRGPQLLSKWVGESERAVRDIFRKARQVAPAIIFFDELDALAPSRGGGGDSHVIESVVNQILTEMDGILEMRGVVVMGASNRPDIIDPALLRAGRFDRLVYIREPDTAGRRHILDIHTRFIPLEGSSLEELMMRLESVEETRIEECIGSLGTDRTVGLDEIMACIGPPGDTAEALSRGARRRSVVALLRERGLSLADPVRDALLDTLTSQTNGYVGSDLALVAREAAMFAMREGAEVVGPAHFDHALGKVRPMMNERLREQYNRIEQYFKGGLPTQVQPPEYQ
jgi:transitional endoplasmic reticulum ATPase